jgi:hypothetical protein
MAQVRKPHTVLLLVVVTCLVAAAGTFTGVAAAKPVSAAQAQYTTVPPLKTGSGVKGAVAHKSSKPSPTPAVKSSGLPFTGLSLGAPVGFALLMMVVGLALRRRFRVRSPRP